MKTERTIAATFASGSSDHTTTNAEPVKTKLLEQEVAEQVHSSVIAEPKRYNDPHPSHADPSPVLFYSHHSHVRPYMFSCSHVLTYLSY